jgi:hypothetical protein
MNANTILNKTLSFVTPNMHATRRNATAACVTSLLAGATAIVTSIGRDIQSYIALSSSCILREL